MFAADCCAASEIAFMEPMPEFPWGLGNPVFSPFKSVKVQSKYQLGAYERNGDQSDAMSRTLSQASFDCREENRCS
jgi:hypothetical protein